MWKQVNKMAINFRERYLNPIVEKMKKEHSFAPRISFSDNSYFVKLFDETLDGGKVSIDLKLSNLQQDSVKACLETKYLGKLSKIPGTSTEVSSCARVQLTNLGSFVAKVVSDLKSGKSTGFMTQCILGDKQKPPSVIREVPREMYGREIPQEIIERPVPVQKKKKHSYVSAKKAEKSMKKLAKESKKSRERRYKEKGERQVPREIEKSPKHKWSRERLSIRKERGKKPILVPIADDVTAKQLKQEKRKKTREKYFGQ